MSAATGEAPAIVSYLKRDAQGEPYLAGSRCTDCGHVYVGARRACANCLARDKQVPVRLGDRGTLYSYTIIHRSFPGAEVPFVDAIVDLDGGGHIKGTLRGVTPDPAAIAFDLPVRVVFAEAVPGNAPGQPHLTYHFVPA